ncbi:MAG: diguanylate cyclase [Aquabacterium sp.]
MVNLTPQDWLALQQALAALGVQLSMEASAGVAGLDEPVVSLADGRALRLQRQAPLRALQMLAEHGQDMLLALDSDLRIALASPATERRLGHAGGALPGMNLADLIAADERADFIARHFTRSARGAPGPGLFRIRLQDGRLQWVQAHVRPLPEGHSLGRYLVTLHEADERKRSEDAHRSARDALTALATTDALTGLPNRRQFDAALQKEWFRAQREHASLALLMIDLDRFKALNDRHGHPAGDAVLARVAQAIAGELRRAGDMAARYGGEEFVAILPGTSAAGAREIAEHIRAAVARLDVSDIATGLAGVQVSIGGAACAPQPSRQPAELLKAADAALYRAKSAGRNRVDIQAEPMT